MNTFLVVMPHGSVAVKAHFPNHSFELVEDKVWALGARRDLTAADICGTLGIAGTNPRRGVVVLVSDYYGRWDPALWQKFNAWNEAQ